MENKQIHEANGEHSMMPVPFRGGTLYLTEDHEEPFVPMKPVVEGIGLSWGAQHVKLTNNNGRWKSVVSMIETTGSDGKSYEMVCLPLKKLPGWLMSIDPNKVNPEIREAVIAYQNECDDVLWDYWSNRALGKTTGGLPPASFHGHDHGSLAPVVREYRAALRGALLLGFSKTCARAKANQVVKDRQKVDVGEIYGLDFSDICSEERIQAETMRIAFEGNDAVIDAFWTVYYQLEGERRYTVNHSRNPDLIAININQFREACKARGIRVPEVLATKGLLKHSGSPTYLDQRAVASAVTGNTVKCWCFRTD